MTAAAAPSARPARSVFTGADVCALAGLSLPGGSARPMFDDQMWDFTDVMGLPVQMQPAHRRFDFTAILDPGWRLVARELIMALLAPRHAAVAPLPRAYRTPLHLNTARGRVAEMRCGREGNTTPPVDDPVLQPLLAAALYLVTTLGPHVAVLHEQIRQAGKVRSRAPRPPGPRACQKNPATELAAELDRHRRSGEPLPELDHASQQDRIRRGWAPADPLLTVNLDAIARQAGFIQFEARWLPPLRDDIDVTLQAVGTDRSWARAATRVARADGQGSLPWTAPMHRFEADALIGITRTATTILTAAVSGMRSSELMELRIGCRRPAGEYAPGF